MKKKTGFLLFTIILMFLLFGCNNFSESDIKTIEVSQFTNLIFNKTMLVPNSEFTWNVSKEDFLSGIYGADTLDPNSDSFDEYRYFYSKETNITTFTPPITYAVDNILGEAEVAFAFDERGLFKSGYVWTFKSNEINKAEKVVTILAEDLNTNENIIENQFEIPDLMNKDTTAFPYRYQWFPACGTQEYIELSILKIQEYIIIEVTVGIS